MMEELGQKVAAWYSPIQPDNTFNLHSIPNWNENVHCVATALSAITGFDPICCSKAVARAAKARTGTSVPSGPDEDFKIIDVLQTIIDFGGVYIKIHDHGSESSCRSRITEYLSNDNSNDLRLIYSFSASKNEAHIFAKKGSLLVDVYTRGRIEAVDADRVPAEYDDFYVIYVFHVDESKVECVKRDAFRSSGHARQ
jgi:hypothetical protein